MVVSSLLLKYFFFIYFTKMGGWGETQKQKTKNALGRHPK
jgi:hypothetical protein